MQTIESFLEANPRFHSMMTLIPEQCAECLIDEGGVEESDVYYVHIEDDGSASVTRDSDW